MTLDVWGTEAHWGRAHFQIIYFRICSFPNCTTLHAGFRGRGGLGAHETSARNEGAGSGHETLAARRAIT